ncbi:glutaminase A [Streptacidiphilus sp. P02-A3a]|uniref:glutaminase A n=1 Tax=Streptacidiphilus sp. P02-A3a TaxID=2704468 RepID=UPI0015F8E736|nr:glutaminase A [Streptacidiphilus sp. P02-A3a]QMU69106.1 glutaminase A [Streptacidiphilus sp. P02-A3a]
MTDPLSAALSALLSRHHALSDGQVADYIPELAGADPSDFGISMVSVHGRIYNAGDAEKPFTIQSVSKPFVYALALSELGLARVARHVGFEPSGEPFNAVSLEPETGRPANPLINAGAIVTTSLIAGDADAGFTRIREALSAFAGRALSLDEDVYRSEASTGDRNRALAYLTSSQGVLARPANEATDIYFRQCALEVTATDLAVMGATLANAGINPVTKRRVIGEDVARIVLSVMSTCGMYDHSGEWMVRVGLPAKSGVGGGITAVLPGEFGIGVYSPPLDLQGNSVRGMAALQDTSTRLGLHVFAPATEARTAIAASTMAGNTLSLWLRGELDFIAAEQIARHIHDQVAAFPIGLIALDLTNVTAVRPIAAELLAATGTDMTSRGVRIEPTDPSGFLGTRPGVVRPPPSAG